MLAVRSSRAAIAATAAALPIASHTHALAARAVGAAYATPGARCSVSNSASQRNASTSSSASSSPSSATATAAAPSSSAALGAGIKSTAYDAVVVGGGHNGLVSAAYLAKAGMKVLVLERRGVVGGAAITEEIVPGTTNAQRLSTNNTNDGRPRGNNLALK